MRSWKLIASNYFQILPSTYFPLLVRIAVLDVWIRFPLLKLTKCGFFLEQWRVYRNFSSTFQKMRTPILFLFLNLTFCILRCPELFCTTSPLSFWYLLVNTGFTMRWETTSGYHVGAEKSFPMELTNISKNISTPISNIASTHAWQTHLKIEIQNIIQAHKLIISDM